MNKSNYAYARIANFTAANVYANQSHVVSQLMKTEKLLDLKACLHNMYEYQVVLELNKGYVSEKDYYERIEALRLELQALRFKETDIQGRAKPGKLKELSDVLTTIKELETDLASYEFAPCREKQINEWWLVSFSYSEKLIAHGETVLRAYDCCWWGRTAIKQFVPLDTVLRNIAIESFTSNTPAHEQ